MRQLELSASAGPITALCASCGIESSMPGTRRVGLNASVMARRGALASLRARRRAARIGSSRMESIASKRSASTMCGLRRRPSAALRRAMSASRRWSRQISATAVGGPSRRMRGPVRLDCGQSRRRGGRLFGARVPRRAWVLGRACAPSLRALADKGDPRSVRCSAWRRTMRRTKASSAAIQRPSLRRSFRSSVSSGGSEARRRVRAWRAFDQRRDRSSSDMSAIVYALQAGRIDRAWRIECAWFYRACMWDRRLLSPRIEARSVTSRAQSRVGRLRGMSPAQARV